MKSKKNIVLIGMMGSGKSSIGKLLSKKVDIDFMLVNIRLNYSNNLSLNALCPDF